MWTKAGAGGSCQQHLWAGAHRDSPAGLGWGLRPCSLLRALPGQGTSGGRVTATAHSQALSISLYLTNCSSEPELFRADSSDSSLEQGDTGTDGSGGSCAGVSGSRALLHN